MTIKVLLENQIITMDFLLDTFNNLSTTINRNGYVHPINKNIYNFVFDYLTPKMATNILKRYLSYWEMESGDKNLVNSLIEKGAQIDALDDSIWYLPDEIFFEYAYLVETISEEMERVIMFDGSIEKINYVKEISRNNKPEYILAMYLDMKHCDKVNVYEYYKNKYTNIDPEIKKSTMYEWVISGKIFRSRYIFVSECFKELGFTHFNLIESVIIMIRYVWDNSRNVFLSPFLCFELQETFLKSEEVKKILITWYGSEEAARGCTSYNTIDKIEQDPRFRGVCNELGIII